MPLVEETRRQDNGDQTDRQAGRFTMMAKWAAIPSFPQLEPLPIERSGSALSGVTGKPWAHEHAGQWEGGGDSAAVREAVFLAERWILVASLPVQWSRETVLSYIAKVERGRE